MLTHQPAFLMHLAECEQYYLWEQTEGLDRGWNALKHLDCSGLALLLTYNLMEPGLSQRQSHESAFCRLPQFAGYAKAVLLIAENSPMGFLKHRF